MNSVLDRLESTRVAGSRDQPSNWPQQLVARYFRAGFVWLPIVVIAGISAFALLPLEAGFATKSEPAPQEEAPVVSEQAVSPSDTVMTQPTDVTRPAEAAPVDGLRISSQSWRRGGLGSNALITFTLRNGNSYAVKDIEISCAFARRDGSHLTDRAQTIHDTMVMKSQRTFKRMHVGFVSVNADRAKCALVTASRN